MNIYNCYSNPKQLHGYQKAITTIPELGYFFAKEEKRRIPKAEPAIIKSPRWAYFYALKIIKGRWLEAEEYIMTDPEFIFFYARDVLKHKWPEAEPYIIKDRLWWDLYSIYVKTHPHPQYPTK